MSGGFASACTLKLTPSFTLCPDLQPLASRGPKFLRQTSGPKFSRGILVTQELSNLPLNMFTLCRPLDPFWRRRRGRAASHESGQCRRRRVGMPSLWGNEDRRVPHGRKMTSSQDPPVGVPNGSL